MKALAQLVGFIGFTFIIVVTSVVTGLTALRVACNIASWLGVI